ncbi:hypothetical protein [Agrobacterium tumefaciens]|uniref:hypothetical protein n=1 Tax=Agrobacterium tumefaciens TaxID=358 RepID=UPI003BA08B01
MRDLAEVTTIDHFQPGGLDRRVGSSASPAALPHLSKQRGSFPVDRLTVPAKGVLIRIPVAVEMFDDCAIRAKHLPQPDLEIDVAVENRDSFLKARLNGTTFRRTMRRVREDQAGGKPVGRLFIVGRIVTPGVITDPGLQYEFA